MKYNLDVLSPLEFEKLSKDIISKKLNLEFKSFKMGKDGGIDLRNKENGIICQCKHIKKFSDLKSILKKELEKVNKLKGIKKYYLIVSTQLSPANEDTIIKIFNNYIKTSEQIISYNEIEDFLDDEENIEILKKNSKLWLTSYKIIELFEQKYMDFEIDNLFKNISSNMNYFVETDVFKRCYEKITNDRILIISGSPGVGKTINSNMLVAKIIATKPELKLKTTVGSNYKELIQTLNEKDYEIIILDDFLGQSYLEKTNDQINEIISIISYVKTNQKKYLILNSRLTVLGDAKMKNEQISRILDSLDDNNYIIDMDNISILEKAEILFNLHYFNDVPKHYFDELKKKSFWRLRYEEIINHSNYNTRILEYCVLNYKKDNISSEKYFDYIMENLSNPRQVWYKQFLNFSKEEISYLHTMYSIRTSNVPNNILKECYEKVIKHRYYDTEKNNFNNITNKLSDNIIVQSTANQEYVMNVFNPSINDFIMNDLKENTLELEKMLEECVYIEQFISLINLSSSLLSTININLLELKSMDNNFDGRLLSLIERYSYYNKQIREKVHNILNNCEESNCQIILEILSKDKLVKQYKLEEYILNVDYLKKICGNSNNLYIKRFIEYLDEYIDEVDKDISEKYLSKIYSELSPIISEKIEDSIRDSIDMTIDDIVLSYENIFEYKVEEDDYIVENIKQIKEKVIDKLEPIIESAIEDETDGYMLHNIEIKNLNVDLENCYEESYIEQSVIEDIKNLNKISETDLENDYIFTIHDVFSQKYEKN